MCLDVTRDSKILTAKRSMRVYKMLNGNKRDGLFSPYRYMTYEIGETYSVPNFKKTDGFYDDTVIRSNKTLHRVGQVDAGLHSLTRKGALDKLESWGSRKIYTAVIPKGTKYIIGGSGEVVSLKLKVTGKRVRKSDLKPKSKKKK
jgi:hypothetical protein